MYLLVTGVLVHLPVIVQDAHQHKLVHTNRKSGIHHAHQGHARRVRAVTKDRLHARAEGKNSAQIRQAAEQARDGVVIDRQPEADDRIGLGARISDITARAMRGELDFAAALRERVGLLRDVDAGVLERVYESVTLMPGAETLIATMRRHGATCALVSGGFTFFTERIAGRLGFDVQQANTLDVADGRISGTVAEPILGREAKLAALERLAREHGLDATETMAVGDGANDLAMLKAAGLGVAFRAKPIVTAEAAASVVHGDLTALLYLQGYTRAEFA